MRRDVVLGLNDELAEKVEEYRRELSKQKGKDVPRTFAIQSLIEIGLGMKTEAVTHNLPALYCPACQTKSEYVHDAPKKEPVVTYESDLPMPTVQIVCRFGHGHRTLSEALICGG